MDYAAMAPKSATSALARRMSQHQAHVSPFHFPPPPGSTPPVSYAPNGNPNDYAPIGNDPSNGDYGFFVNRVRGPVDGGYNWNRRGFDPRIIAAVLGRLIAPGRVMGS